MQTPPSDPSSPFAAAFAAQSRTDDSLLRLLADSVPVLLAYFEASGLRCAFANRRYAQLAGHTTTSIIGHTVRELVGEAAWALIAPHVEQVLQGQTVHYVRDHVMPGGEVRVFESSLVPHFAPEDGHDAPAMAGAFVLINDITHHRAAERAVLESEERMRKFSAATEEGIVFHTGGTILDCNEAMLRLTGYRRTELLGRPLTDFILPEYQPLVLAYTADRREDLYEVGIRHAQGHCVLLEVMGKTMPQAAGGYRVVVARDNTERRQAQARADFLTLHDALTGLPNRHHLMQHLAHTLTEAQARASRVALLFIDLDHFKTVNESLGYEAGDQLLCEVARRLQAGMKATHFAARVGADQFVLVLSDLPGPARAGRAADAILAHLHAPHTIGGVPFSLSACIGISLFPDDGHGADELLRRAAAAMHQTKEAGRGSRGFYAAGMEGQPAALLRQEHLLREAVLHQQFVLHYQPQVDVANGRLHGFEALVRWQHPENGLVGPDDFIPLAESRGLITAIGRWVLREACRQLRAWHDEGLADLHVSVNLSAIEFRQRDVVADIERVLREQALAPRFLEVEITESALMQHADQTRETLAALRQLGVAVTVDDFGTGYSSLAYLKRYPLDKIKVDRSFVMDTPQDADDVAIVTAVVQLARSLQLQSVAEGVETAEQLALLRGLGCNLAQGYGVARPMPAAQAREWARALSA
ncbi:EAL domain-containing protein [Melaminivora sp.]|uniref:putative bifunctional diguanylate cyclase/phosphodiesterase n=1 Tax=Melaminivora sp. TaxID=1933032 RepID=UPI0028A6410A|nr:EAL domain-containing protein [Melaminivora sp.]